MCVYKFSIYPDESQDSSTGMVCYVQAGSMADALLKLRNKHINITENTSAEELESYYRILTSTSGDHPTKVGYIYETMTAEYLYPIESEKDIITAVASIEGNVEKFGKFCEKAILIK